jgi:putative hemolysin
MSEQLVDEAADAGAVDPNVGEIASRALELGGLTAAQVMIPRTHVVALSRSALDDEVRRASSWRKATPGCLSTTAS